MSQEPDHEAPKAWSGLRGAAARVDTEPRLLAALRRLRSRLPGDENFGDPLSTAGETTFAYLARGVSGLQPTERDSLLGEVSMTGLQLWQSLSEATGRGRGDRELALLFTDLVDFSPWVLAAGDLAAVDLLGRVAAAVEDPITKRGGRIAKRLGDGLLATFPDASDAVDAALSAQAAVDQVELDGYRPQMRAGIHWGRPRKLGGDYLGVDVSIAAAVGEGARAGQLLVSAPALEQITPRDGELRIGPRRRLRSPAAPRELEVAPVELPDRPGRPDRKGAGDG